MGLEIIHRSIECPNCQNLGYTLVSEVSYHDEIVYGKSPEFSRSLCLFCNKEEIAFREKVKGIEKTLNLVQRQNKLILKLLEEVFRVEIPDKEGL